jgi:hypothetical protein
MVNSLLIHQVTLCSYIVFVFYIVIIAKHMLFFPHGLINEVLFIFVILLTDIINILQSRINPNEELTSDEEAKWRRYLIYCFH